MRSTKPQPSRVPTLCKYVTRTDRHADAQTMQKSTAVKEREWKKLHPGLQINNCSGQTSWQISRNDKKGKKKEKKKTNGMQLVFFYTTQEQRKRLSGRTGWRCPFDKTVDRLPLVLLQSGLWVWWLSGLSITVMLLYISRTLSNQCQPSHFILESKSHEISWTWSGYDAAKMPKIARKE